VNVAKVNVLQNYRRDNIYDEIKVLDNAKQLTPYTAPYNKVSKEKKVAPVLMKIIVVKARKFQYCEVTVLVNRP